MISTFAVFSSLLLLDFLYVLHICGVHFSLVFAADKRRGIVHTHIHKSISQTNLQQSLYIAKLPLLAFITVDDQYPQITFSERNADTLMLKVVGAAQSLHQNKDLIVVL